MILPIIAYGHTLLKKVATDFEQSDESLSQLIENMWETMYNAKGVGLAAPQVGISKRLFLVDTVQLEKEDEEGINQVFINPKIVQEDGELWAYEEGCLSIPRITGDVERQESVTLRYVDQDFRSHEKVFTGMNARVIQHEYDHLEGILFTDRLKPLKRRLIRRKLENIKSGKIEVDYKMKFKG